MAITPERQTPADFEFAAQLQEVLATWAPSAQPVCHFCRHMAMGGGMTCAAFPEGIPWEIQAGEFDHRQPHPRDRGIRYEPLQPEEFLARAAELRAEAKAGRDVAD